MKFAFPSRLKSMARLGVGGRAGVVQGHRLRAVSEWVGRRLSAATPLALSPVHAGVGAALGSTDQHIWFFFDEIF